jgi:ABC-type glycerol-3-phosphate transport system substrate-binding protein
MATVDKDFRVKNGLVVANGGTFGGAVTVGTPTIAAHAATKEYVDSSIGMYVSGYAPSSPTNGTQWLDTGTNRVNFYYNGVWYTQATIDDTNNLPQHIHDTAIDGTGFIVSQFYEGGSFNSPLGVGLDAGGPSTTEWTVVFDGGSVVDNFN